MVLDYNCKTNTFHVEDIRWLPLQIDTKDHTPPDSHIANHSQNNLYTEGGELYYSDGQEYIGYYHIHPEKGPMEGPEHVDLASFFS